MQAVAWQISIVPRANVAWFQIRAGKQSSETGMAKKKSAQPKEKQHNLQTESIVLQRKAMQCRLLARKFALAKTDSQRHRGELQAALEEVSDEIRTAAPGPLKEAAKHFRATIIRWVDKPGRKSPILTACDALRDVLRDQGVEVNDSLLFAASPSKKKTKLCP